MHQMYVSKQQVHPSWSPLGAERFLTLVRDNFYTDIAFYRSVKRFLTQFGISENPTKKHWHSKQIKDDANLHMGVTKNVISFAGGGANTRSTQLFIAYEDLDFLGKEPWETPFGMLECCCLLLGVGSCNLLQWSSASIQTNRSHSLFSR